jgi:alkylhydroperoxidase/carboxymuconolactone decarboxylase family protein YurZ
MMTLVYGPIYAFSEILPDVETSFAMIAALIAIEAPLQVRWHVDGALRHGATQEEIDAVREIAESVLARIKG